MVTRLSWALSLLLTFAKEEAAPSASEISGGGCPYFHQTACAAEPFKTFLQEWQEKTRCWLCDNRQLVTRARSVLQELLYIQRPELPQVGQEGSLHPEWRETCVSAWILALFASTRSQAVQPWSFYEIGLSLIMGCAFEEATFFEVYGITPSQVAYNFYVLGLPYHRPNPVLHIQEAELGAAERLRKPEDAPLVIDIGMGLGADSRYFLSQGFRVVAVEANRRAIQVAMTIDWVKPLVLEGQLVFLHAAVAPPGGGGSTTTVYAFDDRPEQSNAQAWVEEVGGVATSVRTIECADLLRLFGQAVYMKIDVESSTIDCLDSLVQSQRDAPGRQAVLPKFLSMELEAASLFDPFHRKLTELGYVFYKACRQYVYSPSPCEQGRYSREVPGCGSGPFGVAAVDYLRGLRWSPIDELPNDTQWVEEFEKGLDWFDLHAMRVA